LNLLRKKQENLLNLIRVFSDLFKNSIKSKVVQDKDITIKGLIKISKLIK